MAKHKHYNLFCCQKNVWIHSVPHEDIILHPDLNPDSSYLHKVMLDLLLCIVGLVLAQGQISNEGQTTV